MSRCGVYDMVGWDVCGVYGRGCGVGSGRGSADGRGIRSMEGVVAVVSVLGGGRWVVACVWVEPALHVVWCGGVQGERY